MSILQPNETLSEFTHRITRIIEDGAFPYTPGAELVLEPLSTLTTLLSRDIQVGPDSDDRHVPVQDLVPTELRQKLVDDLEDLAHAVITQPVDVAWAEFAQRLNDVTRTVILWALAAEDASPSWTGTRPIRQLYENLRADEAHRDLMTEIQAAAAARRSAEADAEAAREAVDATRRSAGEQGAWNLEEHYGEYAKGEARSADIFRGAAIVIAIVALAFALRTSDERLTTAAVVHRVGIAVPLLALSGYFVAEASRHRHMAQWANTIQVQLRTFDAFCAPLSSSTAAELRLVFARRVFGNVPQSDTVDTQSVELVQQVIELVRAARA